jgi:threonine dehydrogenase-like Zn-dependent dehydrogenase
VKALVFTAPGVVEMRDDVPEPAVGPDQVLVHVAAAGICGSELHGVRNPGFRVPPLIMGHEFAGTTDDGRRVVVNPIVSCGECDLCGRGLPQLCRRRRIVGVHLPGAFAERVAVPASAVHPLPDAVGWEAGGVAEPAANAVHAWSLAGRPAGSRVGVIGAGAIGLVCLLVAAEFGAAAVDVADLSPDRRKGALRLGAAAAGAELGGEYDVVFDAVGTAATRRQSLARLRPGGTAVWLGLLDDAPGFAATDLVRQELRVLGSFAYTADELAGALALTARWDLSWVTSVPFAEAATVFTALMNGHPDPVKALLRT